MRKNNVTWKLFAGFASFLLVMSIFSSAVAADSLTTTWEDSPPLRDAFSDEVVVVKETNTTSDFSNSAGDEQIQPSIAMENYMEGQETVTIAPSTSEIEVLSFSANGIRDDPYSYTEYFNIRGGNPHLEADLSGDDVELRDYGESVCENLSYSWKERAWGGTWTEVIESHCVDHGPMWNVAPYTTRLSITFSSVGNTSEYNRCDIYLEYINVTVRFSSGNLAVGYHSQGWGGFGNWSGNTFTASWDYWNSVQKIGNLSVTLSQKPSLKHLVVKIEYPGNGFITRTGENVTIAAKVTDDQNNTVTGSSIDSVTARFTTNAQRTPPNLYLYDDGAHDDGSKDDGFYANIWTPDQTGDYTITVTAKKSGLLDGVDTVNGIVIATPVLEIPAQFKHIHPYKDELGKDAPVFQRGVENPQFKISNLTGAQPTSVKLVIEIVAVESGVGLSSVKDITVTESWSATPILVEWDWSTNAGPRNPSDIPVGLYGALAKLVNSSTNAILEESDSKEFYVIFNYPSGESDYVTNHNSFLVHLDDGSSSAYRLHQYNATIWINALNTVSGSTQVKDASRKLREKAYDMGGWGHNYPTDPSRQNAWWFNTLTFLDKRIGVCLDYAALMTAYCRAVGIPARTLTGHGMENNRPTNIVWGHVWVEIFDSFWYWYDPTNEQPPGGTYGTDRYATEGVEFRPLPKYYVVAPGTGGEEPNNISNVYERYTFCADVVNFTFTNAPPGGYDYGQTVQCNVTVANWGAITISRPLNVSIYENVLGSFLQTSSFPRRLDRGDKVIANTLDGGRLASASFSWDIPDYSWMKSTFYELIYERYVNVVVYYRDLKGRKIQTDSYKERIPGLCISPLPFITVDGERRELSNATYSYMNHTDGRSLKTETFVLDVPAVVRTRTEHEAAENYSQAVVSIENPDTGAHNYSFSLQLAGRGDALYLPALGSINSNCTGFNLSTNYLLSYDQANGTDDYIAIHEFSQNVTIEEIEFIEYKGVRGMLINVTWNLSLDRHSSQDIAIYFSRRLGDGVSMPEIHTALAEEIVDSGDSLLTLRIATPDRCRVGDTHSINVTISNNGVTHETINVTVNVTKVMETVPYTVIGLYNGTALTTVSPRTEKNVTFVVVVPELTASGVWDIKAKTDKEIEATSVFDVDDAFDLTSTHNITAPQYSSFTFNATVTNTWDTAVHDVNVTLDFFYGFHTPDPTEKQLGTLSPGESRIISWHLNATAPGELPLEVFVSSSDGGFDTTGSTITSLAPPELWIPNVIVRTTNPDSGTAKTLLLNATIYNMGDVTAHNVQIQLILPENVTSTALTQAIGDLSGGEEKNVSLDITFDTQSDFAFEMIAKDNANHSVTGTVMVSLIGPALPDLTLKGDDIRFIHSLSNSSSSASSEPATLPDISEQQKRMNPPSLKPPSVQERALENLPHAPEKTVTTTAENATYEDRYHGENPMRTAEIKITRPLSIAQSFLIYNLTYPATVNPSKTFQVVVDTAYTFDTSTPVYVGIWDYDVSDYINDTETTLIGIGDARFTFNLAAPASGGMMNLSADLWYWDGSKWVWTDYEDFVVTVTEDFFFSIENVAVPTTVNANQTFQVTVNANYSFDTVTYVYAGIWDYNISDYIAGTSGGDTLVGKGNVSFTFNLTAPSSGIMSLAAALFYWNWDASDWLRLDYQDFTVSVSVTEPDFMITATPSSQTVSQGGFAAYIVSLTAQNGFKSPVTLTISGLPSGTAGIFNPNPVIPTNSSNVTISTSSTTPLGNYTLAITGVSGDITHQTTVILNITDLENVATLAATIHNIGWTEASNVVLQFFDGDPDTGGIQIDSDQTISSIPQGGIKSAEVRWDTTEKVGSHVIYVRIDPNNTIAELNEDNNHAFKQIGVSGVTCSDIDVAIDPAKTSVTDDPVGDGYDLSDAPANVNILNVKGFDITATGPNGTYPFNITFSSPIIEGFVLFKLPEWSEIPYTILDAYTIQVKLVISGGVLDPAFVLASVATLDTSSGTYPSISGEHNGTITPNQTLSVSKLYTYSCAGAGGHTEYAKIYNNSWCVETLPWNGYQGDWHNLSFNEPFVLYQNETYNYTIRTGSYPQIIHAALHNATGGVITCTKFVDANGKQYKNWIPAIKLY